MLRNTFLRRAVGAVIALFVVGGISVAPTAASSERAGPLSVLFIGNSHLLMPGFMKQVQRRLKGKSAKGRPIKTQTVAKIGTTLTKSRKTAKTRNALRGTQWDVIVLQESTTAFMTGHGRQNYMAAVKWFRQNKPPGTKLLLWQTWPQGARHALYGRRGVWGKWFPNPPKGPKQLFSWISTWTDRAAEKNGAFISPIGSCWMGLARRKRPYARDAYHPSPKGIRYIAEILARSVISVADAGGETRVRGACP